MISVVVVYNNKHIFEEVLMRSLKDQTAEFELIALDNTRGEFKSASEALNYGGLRATGRYIMFVHQDVDLERETWLEEVEKILDGIPDIGIAGVAGMSEAGRSFAERQRGHISNSGEIWGREMEKEEEVQTLDELLLIIPRSQFEKMQFDEETFDHWHCYGADYCLSVRRKGLKAYAIPAFVYHRSTSANIKNFGVYKRRLYEKHKRYYKQIHTTSGEISWLKLKFMTVTDLIRPTYMTLFPDWADHLKRDLSGCDTVLDLGCGHDSPIRRCEVPSSVGVDISDANLDESVKKCIHDQYIRSKIELVAFKPKSFDAVISINSTENLSKEEQRQLVERMERWARKKVIIVSTNGGSQEREAEGEGRGWNAKDLEKMGFKIYGICGWRRLGRYDKTDQTRRIISDLTQIITYRHPDYALKIYAVKELEDAPG